MFGGRAIPIAGGAGFAGSTLIARLDEAPPPKRGPTCEIDSMLRSICDSDVVERSPGNMSPGSSVERCHSVL